LIGGQKSSALTFENASKILSTSDKNYAVQAWHNLKLARNVSTRLLEKCRKSKMRIIVGYTIASKW